MGSTEGRGGIDRGTGAHAVTAAGNAGLAALKLGVGTLAGSPVLVADGWHSVSDLAMNALAWGGYRVAQAPPDEDHHYGHGNAEAVAALLVGLVVCGAGVGVVGSVLLGDAEGVRGGAVGGLALAAGLVASAVKLALARHAGRVGGELRSASLVAISRDNLADAASGLLVPVAIGCSLAGLSWVEPVAAAGIGALVVWMGLRSAKEGLDVLMDRSPDPEDRRRVRDVAARVEGVRGVQEVRIHPLGSELRVDMQVSVDGALSVRDGHRIAHAVERAVVAADPRVREVHVHVNPDEPGGAG